MDKGGQIWRSEGNSRRLGPQCRPLSVTSVNPKSGKARKNRPKLTCKGTHVTTYRPINTGVGRRPQGRGGSRVGTSREPGQPCRPAAEMAIMCHQET